MVLWLIGISGAGKTTIGRRLKAYFDELGVRNYMLDGDEVRSLFDNDLGYSEQERRENIKRIILGAYLLDKNDVAGIICNIAPFEDLRAFARKKIDGYHEIYLKKDIQTSMYADVKGVYKAQKGRTALIGIDIAFDEPLNSDLTVEVDKLTEEETFELVRQYITEKYGAQYEQKQN